MKAFPILLIGGAAAYLLTQKKKDPAIGGNGVTKNGKTKGGAEPAIGDTIFFSKTPQNGVMWKVVKSPDGYQARWMDIRDQIWQSGGDFDDPNSAKLAIVDMIVTEKIP